MQSKGEFRAALLDLLLLLHWFAGRNQEAALNMPAREDWGVGRVLCKSQAASAFFFVTVSPWCMGKVLGYYISCTKVPGHGMNTKDAVSNLAETQQVWVWSVSGWEPILEPLSMLPWGPKVRIERWTIQNVHFQSQIEQKRVCAGLLIHEHHTQRIWMQFTAKYGHIKCLYQIAWLHW